MLRMIVSLSSCCTFSGLWCIVWVYFDETLWSTYSAVKCMFDTPFCTPLMAGGACPHNFLERSFPQKVHAGADSVAKSGGRCEIIGPLSFQHPKTLKFHGISIGWRRLKDSKMGFGAPCLNPTLPWTMILGPVHAERWKFIDRFLAQKRDTSRGALKWALVLNIRLDWRVCVCLLL